MTILPKMMPSTRRLALSCVLFYLAVVSLVVASSLHKDQGHFVYALDDPYIHLALAENLAHGHYGINPGEYCSPSSSILWPFLLIPLAGTALHAFVPLAWNLMFGVLTACVIAAAVARYPSATGLNEHRLTLWHYVTAFLLLFVANLASLTIVGMEHVLQVLIAASCAYGILEAIQERPIPMWCLAAVVLGPAVRYEMVSLSLAMAITLIGLRRWRTAISVFALSLLPVVVFSAFLRSKGLPALPMSVLVKGSAFSSNQSALGRAISQIRGHLLDGLIHPVMYSQNFLFLLTVVFFLRAKTRSSRFALGGAAVVGLLQITVGLYGWFHRYEVYSLILLAIVCTGCLAALPRYRLAFTALGLFPIAFVYIFATINTPAATKVIYSQQYQLRRFTTEYYQGDYAVNDLGLLSFQRRPGVYVLDVFGLASYEAASQKVRTAPWLAGIVARHHVGLALLFPKWFQIPSEWTPVGKLCIEKTTHVTIGDPCVVIYSTAPGNEEIIRADLARFAPTLPPSSSIILSDRK